ncbi:NAD-binding protein [Amycolatopsis sp. NPDC059235]|uniref:NAD-binding protein n=1 Tax=Amycolatopsis sp. NPDC059235 TaxID=3346782 RepID=UPI003670A751
MLAAIGRRVWDFGDAADAAPTAKISVNYLIIHALQALSESITLLQHAGLDAGRFVETITDSVFPGPVYRGYGDSIAAGSYTPPGFTTTLGLKDLDLALRTAGDLGVDLPTGPVLHDVFATAVEQIGADLDWASIAEVTRRRSEGTTACGSRCSWQDRTREPARNSGTTPSGQSGPVLSGAPLA